MTPPSKSDGRSATSDEPPGGAMSRRTMWQALVALALLAVGVAAGVLWGERRTAREAQPPPVMESAAKGSAPSPMPGAGRASGEGAPGPAAPDEAVEVTLTPDA